MTTRRIIRIAGILLGYGALFYVFDAQATVFEIAPGVSLWYPSAGLNLALVLIFGVHYTPAIFVALMVSGLWISEPAIPLQHLIVPNLAIAAGNALAAWWLRGVFQNCTLFTPGAIVRLVGAMAVLAAWNSVLASGGYWLTGLTGYTLDALPATIFQWWIGDWAGMLTLTPPLLLGALALGLQRASEVWSRVKPFRGLRTGRAMLELWGEVGAVGLSLYGAFYLVGTPHQLYLCFLPLLWMALRHGLPRSVLGVLLVNLGAVVALRGYETLGSILELQLFIIAFALTGLFIGALVSERQRALDTLHRAMNTFETPTRLSPSSRRVGFSIDDDVTLFADRLHAKQAALADSADTLHDQNQQLRSAGEQLKRQNQRKNQLFSIIAHDLKGSVGTAAGLAEVVETEAQTLSRDMIERFGQHIGRSIGQAQRLLDSLLEWARMYVGSAPEEPSEQAAEALVTAAMEHVEPAAAEKSITLDQDVEPGLSVRGHPALLQAVVRNLLTNAIKFTEPGGRVTVSVFAGEETAVFCIQDNGVGIPPDELDQIFQPGSHASQDGTAGEQGSGLGLALCREIVEQHGGRIWAESTPGEGSAFWFTLPATSNARPTEASEAMAVE